MNLARVDCIRRMVSEYVFRRSGLDNASGGDIEPKGDGFENELT